MIVRELSVSAQDDTSYCLLCVAYFWCEFFAALCCAVQRRTLPPPFPLRVLAHFPACFVFLVHVDSAGSVDVWLVPFVHHDVVAGGLRRCDIFRLMWALVSSSGM